MMGTEQNKHSVAYKDNNHISMIQNVIANNNSGDNVLVQNGDIYIDKSIHVSFSETEGEKMRALLGESNDEYVHELEEKNKKLSEDNERLTDIVLKLQRQLIECLSPEDLLENH